MRIIRVDFAGLDVLHSLILVLSSPGHYFPTVGGLPFEVPKINMEKYGFIYIV